MKILVLDDLRMFKSITPDAEVFYARNIKEFKELVPNDWVCWDQIWLDNDLGNDGPDVYELVKEIEELAYSDHKMCVGEFVVHTANPVARINFNAALSKHYKVRFVRAEDYM